MGSEHSGEWRAKLGPLPPIAEDLQVLGALLDGWPEERIAARLAGATIAERVDWVADRLARSSGPRVLLHAAREGLFVPPPLWPVQP